ncbi:MAG: F0F1 ATP synthase subunit epsilon [Clostridia bacterium]|nr:F0F1 ATP synthase subunit epsilon [Clostridia bacterium]
MKTFELELATPSRCIFKGEVESLIIETIEGYEGFLANHAWSTKLLKKGGKAIITDASGKELRYVIWGGYVDVKEKVLVFTDHVED